MAAASETLVAGDTLSFTVAAPTNAAGVAFKASEGWSLTYRLIARSAAASNIDITASASGDDFVIAVPAAITAGWAAGWYSAAAWVSKGAERYTVRPEFAQMQVLQNPSTAAAGFDGRSPARKAYDDALAAYAAWTPTQRRFQIGDRSVEYSAKDEIQAAIRFWRNRVEAEQATAEGRAAGPLGRMRFGVPN